MAIINEAALVAVDRDMRQMARRFGNPTKGGRFERLHLIFLQCNGVIAAKRIDHLMGLIEHEWAVAVEKSARRLWLEIAPHHVKSFR